MVGLCCRWGLVVAGVTLLLAALIPWVAMFHIPEPYATEWVSAKLLMLPAGAICLGAAAALSARVRH